MWGTVILIFVGMWLLQVVLTLYQNRHYKMTISEMSVLGPGYLGVGVVKRRLGVGAVFILVANLQGQVIEAREMSGVTVFARFRKNPQWEGQPLESLENLHANSNQAQAMKMAVQRIREQQRQGQSQAQSN